MKKIITLGLATILSASLCATAFAQNINPNPQGKRGTRYIQQGRRAGMQAKRGRGLMMLMKRAGATDADKQTVRDFIKQRRMLAREHAKVMRESLAVLRNKNASDADYRSAAVKLDQENRAFRSRMQGLHDDLMSRLSDRGKVAVYAAPVVAKARMRAQMRGGQFHKFNRTAVPGPQSAPKF